MARSSNEVGREKISAFVVCFNEQENIGRCLESLAFCDEIVAIDSFSSDRTVEICKEHGARVIQRPWPGYREQKAFGLQSVNGPWVLNIDADERVSSELRENIEEVLRSDFGFNQGNSTEVVSDGYEVSRVVFFMGRWWRKGGWYPEYRVRFFRKSKTQWGGVDPHEKPIVQGSIGRLRGELHHFTYKCLADQVSRLNSYSSISAREDYLRGKRAGLMRMLFNPLLRGLKFYFLKKGWKEGVAGLIVAGNEVFYTFLKYAKLWEHERCSKHAEKKERDD